MKILNISESGLTAVNDNHQRSDNLIVKVIRIVAASGVAITAMIVAGLWAVLIIGGLMFLGLCFKYVEE